MSSLVPSLAHLSVASDVGVELVRNRSLRLTGIAFGSYLFVQSNGDSDVHVCAVRDLHHEVTLTPPRGAFARVAAVAAPGAECARATRTVLQRDGVDRVETGDSTDDDEWESSPPAELGRATDQDGAFGSTVSTSKRARALGATKRFHYTAVLRKLQSDGGRGGGRRPHTYQTTVTVAVVDGEGTVLMREKVRPVVLRENFESRPADFDPD